MLRNVFGSKKDRASFAGNFAAIAMASALAFTGCATSKSKKLSNEEKAMLYVDAASAAANDGQPATALQDLVDAEKIAPNLPEIYHLRALIYVSKNEYAQAIASAKHSVELNPKYSAANTTLGKLLMDYGKSDEAVPYLLAAAKDDLYPDSYKPLTSLGILYYRKADLKSSMTYLDKAVASDPKGACLAYYYRGHIHLHQGEFKAAIHDYDQATRRFCAGFAEAHLALAIAYERDKQYDTARRKYLEIKNQFSTSSVAEQATSHLKYLP